MLCIHNCNIESKNIGVPHVFDSVTHGIAWPNAKNKSLMQVVYTIQHTCIFNAFAFCNQRIIFGPINIPGPVNERSSPRAEARR
jgi:hypothetical protein